MLNMTQKDVIMFLYVERKPITQERLTTEIAVLGFPYTPQSIRSRMVELERAGYTRRVDRNGTSKHNRPCWRWALTKKGREFMQELISSATPAQRK